MARRWQCIGGGSGGSLAAERGSGRSSAVAAGRQHGGSAAAAARQWRWQLGNSGSTAVEAVVGDGRDEGGEVVLWRLFMFVIFLHISSVPVHCAEGPHIKSSVFV